MSRLSPILVLAALAACGSATWEGAARVVRPGAPGEPSRVEGGTPAAAIGSPRYSESDVRFMQGMIGHHQQALTMTGLVPERTTNESIRLLARRIEVSQRDEIELMRSWLDRRDEPRPVADPAAARSGHHGMLTDEELARLAAARDLEFDRRFLEFMIRHHEGAVRMVSELFASPAGGQETEVFQFASGVAADQPIEIGRMQRMLETLP